MLRHVKEGFGNGASLSLRTGPVRGTWQDSSYTEDSDRLVLEGSENGEFLL